MRRVDFKVSELKEIATALDVTFESHFILENGDKI